MCICLGKSRTAPLHNITIPRLELQAAVLSIRLSEIIQRDIEIEFSEVVVGLILRWFYGTSTMTTNDY